MTPHEQKKHLDDIAARLWAARGELERLLPGLRFAVDQKAIRHILTDLTWATENCSVVGKHQVGEAMNDAMGLTADGKVE